MAKVFKKVPGFKDYEVTQNGSDIRRIGKDKSLSPAGEGDARYVILTDTDGARKGVKLIDAAAKAWGKEAKGGAAKTTKAAASKGKAKPAKSKKPVPAAEA